MEKRPNRQIREQKLQKTKKYSRIKTVKSVLDMQKITRKVIPQSVPYQTVIQKCNKLSLPVDGSFITIDNNQEIVISDPKFKKQFSFPFNRAEFNYDIEPKPFKYDERVNQQLSSNSGNNDPHKFGVAVDYLMQLFGTITSLKRRNQTLIHAAVLLSSMRNGEFQYGFYKSKKNTYILYHRFFKKLSKAIYEDKYYANVEAEVINDNVDLKPKNIKLKQNKGTWQKKFTAAIQPSSNVEQFVVNLKK